MSELLKAFQAILSAARSSGLLVDGQLNSEATVEQWLEFSKDAIDTMVEHGLTLEDLKGILDVASMVLRLRL